MGIRNICTKLWRDDNGVVCTTDIVLITTILVIGMIVGLTSLRNQVVQELGDVAQAIGQLNQSYSFSGSTMTFNGSTFVVAGSSYEDLSDDCDEGDTAGEPPGCIAICEIAATPEQ